MIKFVVLYYQTEKNVNLIINVSKVTVVLSRELDYVKLPGFKLAPRDLPVNRVSVIKVFSVVLIILAYQLVPDWDLAVEPLKLVLIRYPVIRVIALNYVLQLVVGVFTILLSRDYQNLINVHLGSVPPTLVVQEEAVYSIRSNLVLVTDNVLLDNVVTVNYISWW